MSLPALDRCRRAWERTNPQLVLDGWLDMLDELDEPRFRVARFVEPAGLNHGAEPCCARSEGLGLTAISNPWRGPARTSPAGGSAPLTANGPGALPPVSALRGQRR